MKPYFSSREIRALMIFLPLCVLAVAGMRLARPKAGPAEVRAVAHEAERPADSVRLFRFDPNTIDYAGLRQLGLTAYEAASLLKYRAAGKVFRIPEDVAACYGFTDSLYFRLAPYIRIGRKYAVAPPAYRSERVVRQPLAPAPFLIDTVSALYLRAIGALSKRQAEALVRWRDLHGIRDMEELRECYVVSDSVAAALEPYVRFAVRHDPAAERVELNRADSAALCSVYGIGAKSAAAILRYRERLGGFRCVEIGRAHV